MPITQEQMIELATAGKELAERLESLIEYMRNTIATETNGVSYRLMEIGKENVHPDVVNEVQFLFKLFDEIQDEIQHQIGKSTKQIVMIQRCLDRYEIRGSSNIASREWHRRKRRQELRSQNKPVRINIDKEPEQPKGERLRDKFPNLFDEHGNIRD